ncbi:hypothetical protein [Emticicia sp. C21]|uniref:hypothetical protein n=1 Tax=Emticicia sp. C21 TaxID=2302915 RepID=UPI000E352226|nr:hypothetical protein [Emticicia sp. C21]RFS16951.1 hypothetical protein D0T08_09755 [Emticicia sp. C21]
MELKKVDNIVTAFLNKERAFQLSATKAASEKVTNTGGTFLNEVQRTFQLSTTKTASEKVTNTGGTFLNSGRDLSSYQPRKQHQKRLPIRGEPF